MNTSEKSSKINVPKGIIFDIRSDDDTFEFYNRPIFKFMHDNPASNELPHNIMSEYVTELNYNYQTPLMYAVILKNKSLVDQLVIYDVGNIDSFGNSAIDYAEALLNNIQDTSDPDYSTMRYIVDRISEYECRDYQ